MHLLDILLLAGVLMVPVLARLGKSQGHSLLYFYTVMSSPEHGHTRFIVVGYVDDTPIVRYDSLDHEQRVRGIAPWMAGLGSDYWDKESSTAKNIGRNMKTSMMTLLGYYNHSYDSKYVNVLCLTPSP
ncbi:hypothetical protein RHVP.R3 [Cricetid gammaherpesvirus 2]|uniref:MHC class I-like antigen recognition-like domain-containing protein n=1 Tax=Cricetid gammaherpesvirus 2 TaxID=1605972 RepID=E9M5I2_9GAMA|nr:hypothetical protein RHVP.R3 [Cricetid gammaherpesvirus 2]ADW24340.1 hypothetical protein RHVP.R3 [Cricetid gammaherpesvirus 2]ADW24422.1 hypothetical protein RHVP-L.R3 [Cricetid gammaherpesvirus 2]